MGFWVGEAQESRMRTMNDPAPDVSLAGEIVTQQKKPAL
jgi:hypothetical protein